jgi:hypothetical protein
MAGTVEPKGIERRSLSGQKSEEIKEELEN